MNVELDWQAGDEEGRWETIAEMTRKTRYKMPWRILGVLAVVLLTFAVGGYGLVVSRYRAALAQVAFQIQSAIDVEARALAQRDVDLYMAQQDGSLSGWFARQAVRIHNGAPAGVLADVLQDDGSLAPAQIEEVTLHGDIAWVQVIAGQDAIRQVRFYRRTDLGWKRTAPQVAFWGEPVERVYDEVTVRTHERDLPHVEPLVEHVARVYGEVCATLECPPDDPLRVDIAVEMSTERLPIVREGTLTLASPWLDGIPIERGWDEATTNDLTYWTAYAAALRAIDPTPGALHPLQRAILVEYATLYANQDAAQAPMLRRIIARQGSGALPEVLHSLKDPVSMSRFVARWLSISPSTEDVYFETLSDVMREAVSAGREETVLLVNLLLYENADRWMAWIGCLQCEAPRSYEEFSMLVTSLWSFE